MIAKSSHPELDQIAVLFQNHPQSMSEIKAPNVDRWERIVYHYKERYKVRLYEDHNAIFRRAYEEADGEELSVYADLADFRSEFFQYLLSLGVGMFHVNMFEQQASAVWSEKLNDRIVALKLGQPMVHRWLH